MFLETDCVNTSLITLRTRIIWCFPSMSFHMSFEITGNSETLITLRTRIWCFPSMSFHMSFEKRPGSHMIIDE